MSYSAKDYEFLGRQVAAGRYVTRSFCIMAVVCALLAGGIVGNFLTPRQEQGAMKKPLGAGSTIMPDKQHLDAIMQLEQKLLSDPNNVEALVQLGNLYFDSANYAQSVTAYTKALALKPDMPDVLVDCGIMYRALGQFDKALESFDKALALNPKHEFALFNGGVVLHNDLKDDEKAFSQWRKLFAINPQFKTPDGKLLADLLKDHEQAGK